MDSAKPIYKYLARQNSRVVDLVTYGRTMNRIKKALKPHINQRIGDEFQVSTISGNEVTLLVYSAELASRLRFQSANLLQQIRTLESCKLLNKINIRVRPKIADGNAKKASKQKSVLIPSRTGKQHLTSLAENIDDPALKASLQRLADRVYPRQID